MLAFRQFYFPLTLSFLAIMAIGCSHAGNDVEISERRIATSVPPKASVGMPSAQRFGRTPIEPKGQIGQQNPLGPDNDLHFDLPAGWKEIASSSMRLVNLQPAADADASCYVSVLGGDGGGLTANLNRWRKQMGLAAATEAELLALPTIKLLGGDATLIELEGSFTGMDGNAQTDWGLIGAVASTAPATIFVKMTGTRELIAAERENFLNFVASLHFGNHAEHDDSATPMPETTPKVETGRSFTANGFHFELPVGWSDAGPKTMRTLNLRAGEQTECYLVVLGGTGGGIEANLNRWQSQLGLAALSSEEIDALPRVDLIGKPAYLYMASGDYAGMSDIAKLDMTMLAVAQLRDQKALFLKMVGPSEEVIAQRAAFLDFVASLEEVQ